MILLLSLGQVKNVVKFTQTSLGGFPEHPDGQKNKGQAAARDTGINWSGYNELKFEVQSLLVLNFYKAQCKETIVKQDKKGEFYPL